MKKRTLSQIVIPEGKLEEVFGGSAKVAVSPLLGYSSRLQCMKVHEAVQNDANNTNAAGNEIEKIV